MASGLMGLGAFGGSFDRSKDDKKTPKKMRDLIDWLAANGRGGDTMVAHINPQEAAILQQLGGAGTTNPATGLPEFYDENGNPGGFGGNLSSGAGDAQAQGSGVTGAGSWGSGYSGTAGNLSLANPQGYSGGYASNYGGTSAINPFRGGVNPGTYNNGRTSYAAPTKSLMSQPPSATGYDFSVGPSVADQQAFQQANPGLISSGNFNAAAARPPRSQFPSTIGSGYWNGDVSPGAFGRDKVVGPGATEQTGWGGDLPAGWGVGEPSYDPNFNFGRDGSITTMSPDGNYWSPGPGQSTSGNPYNNGDVSQLTANQMRSNYVSNPSNWGRR